MYLLVRLVRRSPWLCNVALYGSLFAAGDAAQQRLRRRPGQSADWAQTRHVALVALSFHGHFNYVWLRALERLLPGRAPAAVLAKVLCDQLMGAPVAVLAFYTGMSILQGKEDVFADCRDKFWNTYKTGLMYWPFVQVSLNLPSSSSETHDEDNSSSYNNALNQHSQKIAPMHSSPHPHTMLSNFSLVPVHWRTAYTGLCGFIWATFLCFSQQSGDGTAKSVFLLFRGKKSDTGEMPPGK